jgi:phosphoribosylcarboxyaminoimidazole (NCAIR) mutase
MKKVAIIMGSDSDLPIVEKGINVKLGLIAVEHYDDVAMELTELNQDNYEQIIADGLAKIISI